LYSTLFNIDLVYTNIKYDSTLYFYMYSVFWKQYSDFVKL
jgi:hypothetical protein